MEHIGVLYAARKHKTSYYRTRSMRMTFVQ